MFTKKKKNFNRFSSFNTIYEPLAAGISQEIVIDPYAFPSIALL